MPNRSTKPSPKLSPKLSIVGALETADRLRDESRDGAADANASYLIVHTLLTEHFRAPGVAGAFESELGEAIAARAIAVAAL